MTDNPIAAKESASYVVFSVNTKRALKSYQLSILAHEVMHSDGRLKGIEDLSERQAALRNNVLEQIEKGESLPRPVVGIGINDNFELGAGRDVFMTLATLGHSTIEVHMRKSQLSELEDFKN